jgi:hypothetical protein
MKEPRSCENADKTNLKISFTERGNWAYIGTDGRIVDTPVVSLESVGRETDDDIARGLNQSEILHEFGHVLGFVHAWLFPDCENELNWPVIYSELGATYNWTKAVIDQNLRPSNAGTTVSRGIFDKNSVMGYALPPSFFKKGKESSCFMEQPGELSLQDKLAVFSAYP